MDLMLNALTTRIGIPQHTKFCALYRVRSSWHVWISVRDYQVPYDQWQGTYLDLDDRGGVSRVTVYDDGHEDIMVIK